MTFRPSMPDGTLLYSDDSDSGDFLAINLVDRYVEFQFDCGSGGATIRLQMQAPFSVSSTFSLSIIVPTSLPGLCCVCGGDLCYRSEEQISMNSWHELRVSRTAKSGILQVDAQRPMEGITEVLCFVLSAFKFYFHILMIRAARRCSG